MSGLVTGPEVGVSVEKVDIFENVAPAGKA